jgi:hypothetical protein
MAAAGDNADGGARRVVSSLNCPTHFSFLFILIVLLLNFQLVEEEELRKIFVANLRTKTTDLTLRQFYANFGTVRNAYISRDFKTKR